MQKLTTKNKLSLQFSLYLFAFIVAISVVFIAILRVNLIRDAKKSVTQESVEIIRDHISITDGQIELVADKNGVGLAETITGYGYSALFLDKNANYIKGFGLFEFYQDSDSQNISKIVANARMTEEIKKSSDLILNWRGNKLYLYFFPIVKDSEVYGVGILTSDFTPIDETLNSVYILFMSLMLLGFLGSFILGYVLVGKAFKPLTKLSRTLENVNLNKLDTKLRAEGNPYDDLVVLIKKFNEMLDRLNVMAQRQKDFVSNVSHELKTPLTRSISTLEVISLKNPEMREKLGGLKEDLFEISSLISEILELSGMDPKNPKKKDRIDLKSVIAEVLEKFKKEIKAKGIEVETNIASGTLVYFPTSYAKIIFSNIISNAIKYNVNYGKIAVLASSKDDYAEVVFENQSASFEKKEKMQIFKRFFRGESTKNREKGYGIGLSLIRDICDLYGVKIGFEMDDGKSMKVSFLFPNRT